MTQLIKIQDNDGKRVVSARELHQFLEVKTKFADWIKARVLEYGFIENQDFVTSSEISEGRRNIIEYALSLDMAKELAMVERSEKGREARKYFIACEQAAVAVAKLRNELELSPLTPGGGTNMNGLLKEARRMAATDNRTLAKRCGVSKGVLERIMYNDRSRPVNEATVLGVEAVCRKIVATASLDYDADGVELLMGVEDSEVRKALFEKMKKGGAI